MDELEPPTDVTPNADELPRVDENGVDLTLVRYTLGLTPTERLKSLESFMNVMSTVRVRPHRG